MLVLRILFLFSFLYASATTFASADSFKNTLSDHYESDDKSGYDNNKVFTSVVLFKTEPVPQHYFKIVPEVFFITDPAKVAISKLKRFDDSFQYLKNNPSIGLKLDSHLISFQFHAFP